MCLIITIFFVNTRANSKTVEPLSLFWGFAVEGYPITDKDLLNLEGQTGIHPKIVVFFLNWPSAGDGSNVVFPKQTLEAVESIGSLPCLSWDPRHYDFRYETTISSDSILNGDYDTYIRRFANEAKKFKRPFLIRFGRNMNLERFHWGTERNNFGPDSPDIYKSIYRHVVYIFRRQGAKNVKWVFCPGADSMPGSSAKQNAGWNKIENYFPGDDYVDVFGLDGYNWGTSMTTDVQGWDSRWKTFREIFEPAFKEISALAGEKPVVIFEAACSVQGGDKNQWIREAFDVLKEWRVQGIVWYHAVTDCDWRFNTSTDDACKTVVRERTSTPNKWLSKFKVKQ